jgi:hypothetical protein
MQTGFEGTHAIEFWLLIWLLYPERAAHRLLLGPPEKNYNLWDAAKPQDPTKEERINTPFLHSPTSPFISYLNLPLAKPSERPEGKEAH